MLHHIVECIKHEFKETTITAHFFTIHAKKRKRKLYNKSMIIRQASTRETN